MSLQAAAETHKLIERSCSSCFSGHLNYSKEFQWNSSAKIIKNFSSQHEMYCTRDIHSWYEAHWICNQKHVELNVTVMWY